MYSFQRVIFIFENNFEQRWQPMDLHMRNTRQTPSCSNNIHKIRNGKITMSQTNPDVEVMPRTNANEKKEDKKLYEKKIKIKLNCRQLE